MTMVQADLKEPMARWLGELFQTEVRLPRCELLAGGASHQAWAVDVDCGGQTRQLVVRRSLGGKMFVDALDRRDEFTLLQAAWQAGVPVPRPWGFTPDLAGSQAFAMARLQGETIGRRIVRELAGSEQGSVLVAQMATALAAIHKLDAAALPGLPRPPEGLPAGRHGVRRLRRELDAVAHPYPAIEWALSWLAERVPDDAIRCVCHGDYRIGNVVVAAGELAGILDWEFGQIGHPLEDIAFGAIRAWRFGSDDLHYGGIAPLGAFLTSYNVAAGSGWTPEDLYFWEVLANAKWAVATVTQAHRHLSGAEPSLELASLGRMTCEIEMELLSLVDERHPRYPAALRG